MQLTRRRVTLIVIGVAVCFTPTFLVLLQDFLNPSYAAGETFLLRSFSVENTPPYAGDDGVQPLDIEGASRHEVSGPQSSTPLGQFELLVKPCSRQTSKLASPFSERRVKTTAIVAEAMQAAGFDSKDATAGLERAMHVLAAFDDEELLQGMIDYDSTYRPRAASIAGLNYLQLLQRIEVLADRDVAIICRSGSSAIYAIGHRSNPSQWVIYGFSDSKLVFEGSLTTDLPRSEWCNRVLQKLFPPASP